MAGVLICLLVASTLVSATQCMKALYWGGLKLDSRGLRPALYLTKSATNISTKELVNQSGVKQVEEVFYAPFFTTWFCSMGTIFFLPIYIMGLLLSGAKSSKIRTTFKEGIQGYRNKGFAFGKPSFFPRFSTEFKMRL